MHVFRRLIIPACVLLVAACTPSTVPQPSASTTAGSAVFDANALTANLNGLPGQAGADLKPQRLASGLVPPTNRWFSGLVFGAAPLPVFPLPLSFSLTDTGFAFGLPNVTTNEKTIMGSYNAAVPVKARTGWKVSAYDEMSVTMSQEDGDSIRIAEGSPYITYTAGKELTLTTDGLTWQAADGYATTTVAGATYGVTTSNGVSVSGSSVTVAAKAAATWFVVPTGGDAKTMATLAAPLASTSVSYTTGDTATTTLTYATATGAATAFATLPHQQSGIAAGTDCSLGTWPSIFGTLTACRGNELTWSTRTYPARVGLDLSGISDAESEELKAQLAKDVDANPAYPADTYFGGKALYRDAQLLSIAEQLGADSDAKVLRGRLLQTMNLWMDPTRCADTAASFCFFHDTTNLGVVGRTPSFGSEQYNDHHFHYGYFLYAAGVLAADDPELAAKWAPVMNTLAADIANSPASQALPERRVFDAYASHSWASGTSPFADGNNQESSSEAVNAWAGLTLWARASGNTALESEAVWMHALEAQSARAYWTDFDTSDAVYTGFKHSILPLNFGGKRDYATWFSPEPAAAMAILVIPASPSSDHLAGDPERIRANVAEATASGGFEQTYGSYLLMYSALAGETERAAALKTARTLSNKAVDDGVTRTYLLAFLMA